MPRKGIRAGFVARSFNIPEELDEKLRLRAIKDKVRFSDIAILSFRHYLNINKVGDKE